jgi:hypothetical protein
MLSGLVGSSSVLISVEPNDPRSTIVFGPVYRLNLLPLFNLSGRSHAHEDAEIVLSPDRIPTCSVTLCDDGVKLEDSAEALVASLPAGHYWSLSNGTLVD